MRRTICRSGGRKSRGLFVVTAATEIRGSYETYIQNAVGGNI